MHTRDYGDILEKHVIDVFDNADITLKQFNNSGAVNKNDSDLHNDYMQIECKRNGVKDSKGKSHPRFKPNDWAQIVREARTRNKVPALVMSGDNYKEAVITLKLDDFVTIYSQFMQMRDDGDHD